MKKIFSKATVYVKQSSVKGAGRGVFAQQDIKKGECIEICPVITIPAYDMANLNESILLTCFFFHGDDNKRVYIALGFGSLYNHSYTPSAMYTVHTVEKTIEFFALKDIRKNDEITFNYKFGTRNTKNPLWFEV